MVDLYYAVLDGTDWRVVAILGLFFGLFLVGWLLYRLVARLIPWDCPYCGFPALRRVAGAGPDTARAVTRAAERVAGWRLDPPAWRVCSSCKRVVDPAILLGQDPARYWVVVPQKSTVGNPGEVVAYPPVPCRRCGQGFVTSGGPPEFRTCGACGTVHQWCQDEESGYSFYIADPSKSEADAGPAGPGGQPVPQKEDASARLS